jgi:hypothetical protein
VDGLSLCEEIRLLPACCLAWLQELQRRAGRGTAEAHAHTQLSGSNGMQQQ